MTQSKIRLEVVQEEILIIKVVKIINKKNNIMKKDKIANQRKNSSQKEVALALEIDQLQEMQDKKTLIIKM